VLSTPSWIPNPLGKYYLYFAHHQGTHIRLAYADRLEGLWQVYEPGTLQLDQTRCHKHIASPDVHLDNERREVLMYFHGDSVSGQKTFVATSGDGVRFRVRPQALGPSYFRVFRYGDWHYAICKTDPDCLLMRSKNELGPFKPGPHLLTSVRHTALLVAGDKLAVFCSRIGDAPEGILVTYIHLEGDWMRWQEGAYSRVLEPEMDYEGALLPVVPSRGGMAEGPVCQLRDPCIYCEQDRTYLFYTVAGEQGIAIAELS
jgi:hypothetical protein